MDIKEGIILGASYLHRPLSELCNFWKAPQGFILQYKCSRACTFFNDDDKSFLVEFNFLYLLQKISCLREAKSQIINFEGEIFVDWIVKIFRGFIFKDYN